ncbi:hypothetical protein DRF65_11600 [Chryseobacterium pennae]|uniref:Uncharacterized protein n=1 Tax=Chryseobacterium pennae TaxID=2258962 RepID=A0A3D9C9B6_9FLAO|nr:hypothetical protein DRF65_11600 [Chryseobacterium pennae]
MEKHRRDIMLEYLASISKDQRLNVYHVSLLLGIFKLAYLQNQSETDSINVSRSKLMFHSHILTTPTYHKYFKQLQTFGYIKYTPSYHPAYKSTIDFLNFMQLPLPLQ